MYDFVTCERRRQKMPNTKADPTQRRSSDEVAERSLRPDVRARLDKAIASLDHNMAVSLEDVIAKVGQKTDVRSA